MLPDRPHEWIALLQRLADRADAVALRHFRVPSLAVFHKTDRSPVTEADREIEREIRALAHETAPTLGLLGEEYGELPGASGVRLIVDPIDATLNFVRGDPVFATLLAVEVYGQVVAGLVSAPALLGRWWAARGAGAWRDGCPIRVSARRELAGCRLFCGTPADEVARARYPLEPLLAATHPVQGVGDFLQHLWVAEGRGEIAIDLDVAPWDIAALQIIVEEAGGTATTLDGRHTLSGGTLLTTNGWVHAAALTCLERAQAVHGARVPVATHVIASPLRDL
ncbi:MAG: histidinol-phosphatase [Betaproteobacteria bacterium]|nr:histidinol-phosphatase [Betaproteobacteria bacterium]